MKILPMKILLAQAGRFGVVGLAATLVHLLIAWLAHNQAEMMPVWANAFGFLVAFTFSYVGHFYWTFGQRAGHRVRLPRFVAVSATGFALSSLITRAVTRGGQDFDLALALILVTVPLTTWLLSRLWAFRD